MCNFFRKPQDCTLQLVLPDGHSRCADGKRSERSDISKYLADIKNFRLSLLLSSSRSHIDIIYIPSSRHFLSPPHDCPGGGRCIFPNAGIRSARYGI